MKILLIGFAMVGVLLVYRLGQLQFVEAEEFLKKATAPEQTQYKPIFPTRGKILARGAGGKGFVELIGNELCFEVAVYYPVMDPDLWWINAQHRSILRKMREKAKNPKLVVPKEELAFTLRQDIDNFWTMLSQNTPISREELFSRRDRVVQAIQNRIAYVHQHREDFIDDYIEEQRWYYPLVSNLDEKQALELRGKLADTPWAVVRPSVKRVFREGDVLCHILGRTSKIPGSFDKFYRKNDDEDDLPGELRGREGLERTFDKRLRGTRGWVKLEKEPKIDTPPEDGSDIVLTIDIELQKYIQKRLMEQIKALHYATAGAAVVIDVKNNELLAMVSVPTYDPDSLNDIDKFEKLLDNSKYLPLIDRVLNATYEPGSIVKPFVGAWAIQHKKVGMYQSFECTGQLFPNVRAFRCWMPPPGHGPVDYVHSLAHSCDIFYYKVGEAVTAEGMCDLYRSLGLDQPVPLGVSPDSPRGIPNRKGHVPDPAWFIRTKGRGMSVGDARNLAIGQGDLNITPLQGVLMTKAILTGEYQAPKILTDEPAPPGHSIGIKPSILALAKEGMRMVVNDPQATGYTAAYTDKLVLAGKTGSATAVPRQVEWEASYRDPITGQIVKMNVTNKDKLKATAPVPELEINWRTLATFPTLRPEDQTDSHGRSKNLAHGWFTGYAPAGNPKLVAIVFIEYGIAGGSAAGPVFKDIMLKCQELGYLK